MDHEIIFGIVLLDAADFSEAEMPHTKFERTRCVAAHFDRANLSQSIFYQVNAKNAFFNNADLTNANFSLANLDKADVTGTQLTCSHLQSVLSIRDALLPDRTCGHDSNLIGNGHADCNVPLLSPWILTHGKIASMKTEVDYNNCHFVAQSNNVGASMYQKIDLVHWDSGFWKYSLAVLDAHMTNGVSIELSGMSRNEAILDKKILGNCNGTMYNTIMLTTFSTRRRNKK